MNAHVALHSQQTEICLRSPKKYRLGIAEYPLEEKEEIEEKKGTMKQQV